MWDDGYSAHLDAGVLTEKAWVDIRVSIDNLSYTMRISSSDNAWQRHRERCAREIAVANATPLHQTKPCEDINLNVLEENSNEIINGEVRPTENVEAQFRDDKIWETNEIFTEENNEENQQKGEEEVARFSYYRPHRGPPPHPPPPLKMDQHQSIWINMNIHIVLLHAL